MSAPGVYTQSLRVKNRDVDMHRRVRASRLFEWLQEASIAHTERLGMGREKTLDRGLLWVVTLQRSEIERMPEYDEDIRVESWPGETMHLLFPRYYRVLTAEGEELVRGSALWMLVDGETRRFVFPEKHGIVIPGTETGYELPLPAAPAALETTETAEFTVPYSYVDLNGHMNNTRYFDLAEDMIGAAAAGRRLRAAETEFKAEIRHGETVSLRWGWEGGRCYFEGSTARPAFSMLLSYDAKNA